MSITLEHLKKATNEFFERHWNAAHFGSVPEWSKPWDLTGSLPNGERQGTYAFLSQNEIIYVGIGNSRGKGIYAGCGLGARINAHTRVQEGGLKIELSNRPYEMRLKWKEVDHVVTIGFDQNYSYLAAALEIFLIRELKPRRNINRPGQ